MTQQASLSFPPSCLQSVLAIPDPVWRCSILVNHGNAHRKPRVSLEQRPPPESKPAKGQPKRQPHPASWKGPLRHPQSVSPSISGCQPPENPPESPTEYPCSARRESGRVSLGCLFRCSILRLAVLFGFDIVIVDDVVIA